MHLSVEVKKALVKQFGKNEKDTGAPGVQIALLTKRIESLRPHFEGNKHDYHSNRGLLKMIGKRKSLLKYLNEVNPEEYKKVITELGIRK